MSQENQETRLKISRQNKRNFVFEIIRHIWGKYHHAAKLRHAIGNRVIKKGITRREIVTKFETISKNLIR